MGSNEETHPLYNNPPRVTKWSLSAGCFNMDNQSKKTNPNSSVVTKQFGFACSGGDSWNRTNDLMHVKHAL